MRIEQTNYYRRITAQLRTPELARHIAWGAEGFAYTSNSMAYVLTRLSKNNYRIDAVYSGRLETYTYESIRDAIAFAIELVNLDRGQ